MPIWYQWCVTTSDAQDLPSFVKVCLADRLPGWNRPELTKVDSVEQLLQYKVFNNTMHRHKAYTAYIIWGYFGQVFCCCRGLWIASKHSPVPSDITENANASPDPVRCWLPAWFKAQCSNLPIDSGSLCSFQLGKARICSDQFAVPLPVGSSDWWAVAMPQNKSGLWRLSMSLDHWHWPLRNSASWCILMHIGASCLSPSYHLVIPCPRCPRSWPGQASESPWRQTNWRDCRDAAKRGGFSLLFGLRSSWFLTNSQKQVIFSDCNEGKLCVTRWRAQWSRRLSDHILRSGIGACWFELCVANIWTQSCCKHALLTDMTKDLLQQLSSCTRVNDGKRLFHIVCSTFCKAPVCAKSPTTTGLKHAKGPAMQSQINT